MFAEKRMHVRKRVFMGATVEFSNRLSTMSCLVRNLSDGGAMIACDDTAALPGAITLAVPQRGERREARIVWRRRDAVGLAFHGGPA